MNGDMYSSRGETKQPKEGGSRHGSSRDPRESRDHGHSSRPARDDYRSHDRPRRRSRSPHRTTSRRDYEIDSYSTSRDYREREREDRYRDRRDGPREWDRDRALPHRDPRRPEADRPLPRRGERDLFDDRRGPPPRGGGRDRDGFPPSGGGGMGGPPRDRDRKMKSPSPPPKKKEPTPDLTDVVSILDRKRRLTQWDIKPQGYDKVTAEQAKLSGMFPLPGAPRQQPMDPSRLQAFMNPAAGSATNTALSTSNARQSKRLFIYNLPSATTDASLHEFFNLQLNGLNVVSGADPCTAAHVAPDKSFALLEFKAPEDATMAVALDGINTEADSGDAMDTTNGETNGASKGLSISRPKDYIVPTAPAAEQEQAEGVINSTVIDGPNKISISNIPVYLTDEQVQELLVAFGELKAFTLVKDTSTEQSRGIAFCEYADEATTAVAVEGLNGMELGDQNLKVALASIGITQAAGMGEMGVSAMSLLAGTASSARPDQDQGRVLQLLNMVTPEELMDYEEYQEILEDIRTECGKYGTILDLKIPRPVQGNRQSPGIGKIYIKYEDAEGAQKAFKALGGRQFQQRTVVVTYFGEEYFDVNAW
ncbi:MAG: hypothetical protein M1828_001105 [Chrysothrix sp. TS-e1954]|nr:MAG: hypothetical protein M1828_001105 [Chrysothrix sp. TS-e1954]